MMHNPSTYAIKRILKDRAFEIFISQVVPAIPSVLTVLVWLAIIGGLVWGVAGWQK